MITIEYTTQSTTSWPVPHGSHCWTVQPRQLASSLGVYATLRGLTMAFHPLSSMATRACEALLSITRSESKLVGPSACRRGGKFSAPYIGRNVAMDERWTTERRQGDRREGERRKPGRPSKGPREEMTVRLPAPLAAAVRELAAARGMTIQDMVGEWLADQTGVAYQQQGTLSLSA